MRRTQVPAKPIGPSRQVAALVELRWAMIRSPRTRHGLLGLAGLLPALFAGALVIGRMVPPEARVNFTILAPTAMLGFAVLSIAAPLVSGGGNEIFPDDQLVAYPIGPVTAYLSGIALLLLNLAWITQLVVVAAIASVATHSAIALALALVTAIGYIGLVTTGGQAAGWLIVGLRQTRLGRQAVWAAASACTVAVLVVVRAGNARGYLDRHNPALRVFLAMVAVDNHNYTAWGRRTALLVVLMAVAIPAGRLACAWALRRPGDGGVARESRVLRRRTQRRSDFWTLQAVDRASVWRSPALRRGIFVLTLLPGGIAGVAGASWDNLVILPGLVTAGAGLLFGINVLCVDGAGAVFFAGLPTPPALVIRSKTLLIAQTCLGCASLAVVAGVLRADTSPSPTQAAALFCAVIVNTALVVGTCLRLSVDHPHRADLRGPRDTPAPPGAMAVASLRLAGITTLVGLALSIAAHATEWWVPVVVSIPLGGYGLLSTQVAWRRWDDPSIRAGVVAAVSAG